jgi:hypothetical protein
VEYVVDLNVETLHVRWYNFRWINFISYSIYTVTRGPWPQGEMFHYIFAWELKNISIPITVCPRKVLPMVRKKSDKEPREADLE